MYSHVKRIRFGGKRKADRDISIDAGVIGHINVFIQAGEIVATVYAGGGTGRQDPMLPALYRARLVTMHGDGMLFQGWERPRGWDEVDTDTNKQEWSVKILLDPPMPEPSERMG